LPRRAARSGTLVQMATLQPPVPLLKHDRACVRCGYGVASLRAPDRCPMCGGTTWRPREFIVFAPPHA